MTLDEWKTSPLDGLSDPRRYARAKMREIVATFDFAATKSPIFDLQSKIVGQRPTRRSQTPEIRAWNAEWLLLHSILDEMFEPPEPTADDHAACLVALDLVEMERFAEAIAMIAEHAPRAFNRKCPACSQPVGHRCEDMVSRQWDNGIGVKLGPQQQALKDAGEKWVYPRTLIVPHLSRVQP